MVESSRQSHLRPQVNIALRPAIAAFPSRTCTMMLMICSFSQSCNQAQNWLILSFLVDLPCDMLKLQMGQAITAWMTNHSDQVVLKALEGSVHSDMILLSNGTINSFNCDLHWAIGGKRCVALGGCNFGAGKQWRGVCFVNSVPILHQFLHTLNGVHKVCRKLRSYAWRNCQIEYRSDIERRQAGALTSFVSLWLDTPLNPLL